MPKKKRTKGLKVAPSTKIYTNFFLFMPIPRYKFDLYTKQPGWRPYPLKPWGCLYYTLGIRKLFLPLKAWVPTAEEIKWANRRKNGGY